MRIAYFAPTVCIGGMDGGATHVYEVIRRLAGEHEITLVADGNVGGLDAKLVDVSSNMRFVKYVKAFMKAWHPVLKSDIVYERTDLVGVGSFLSIIFGRPLVLETNSMVLEERVRNPLIRRILGGWLKIRYRRARKIVVTLRSLVPEEFWGKVFETEWGVDVERFNPGVDGSRVRRTLGLEGKRVVLFSGASGPWHGLQDLLDVVPLVRQKNHDVEFVCIGRITDESIIKRADKTEGVRVLGPLPYAEVPSYLASADVLVAPFNDSYYPTLKKYGFYWSPLKIFEYMASGKPIVSTKPLSRIIKDGVEGILVEPGDVGGMADAIIFLLENPAKARNMGENARKKAATKYTWSKHVERLMEALKYAVAR